MSKQDQLSSVILASRPDRVAPLLSRGANVNEPDQYGNTPLYFAAVHGETEIVRILLAAGADPNKESFAEDQGTPLCAAAAWGHTEIVRLLLEGGADPNLVERGQMTALIWARQNRHTDTEEALLSAGADPDLDPRAIVVGDPRTVELRPPGPDAAAVYDREIALGLLHKDKASGEEHYVVRYPAGVKGRIHTHTAAHTMLVLEGHLYVNGQVIGPGGYAHLPAGQPMHHQSGGDDDCLFVLIFHGPFDVQVVDD